MSDNLKTNISYKAIECDVLKMDIGEEGLKNYRWPISNQERTGFGLNLVTLYAQIIKSHGKKDGPSVLPYKFFGVHFLNQVVAVFQGDLLRERALQNNVRVQVPDDWSYWPYLLQEETPAEPEILDNLKNGPERVNYTKKIFNLSFLKKIIQLLNFRRSGFQVDGLKVKPITSEVLQKSIIATQRTDLIIAHAKEVEKEVVFKRSNRWFDKISDEELDQSILLNDKTLEKKIIDMIAKQYRCYNIDLKPHSLKFIKNILERGPALCRVHYNRLLSKLDKLPHEVWAGTAGQYWDMMLRVAVMQNGGKAFGHDHGSGCAYIKYPLCGIAEYWGCDAFFTFNKNSAQEMEKTATQYPRYDDDTPEMKHVSPKASINKIRDDYKKTKTVFIMASVYDGDYGRIGPGTPNNFLVDLQSRMIKKLKDMGYDVLIKIHPETEVMPPKAYEELGAKITKIPFKDIMDQADLVIFDCIFTTAFTDCLQTNIPIVLIDFFGFPWTPRGKKLISKRCKIVESDYKDCRANPNWNEVEQAIKIAPEKCNNHEFYKTYFC